MSDQLSRACYSLKFSFFVSIVLCVQAYAIEVEEKNENLDSISVASVQWPDLSMRNAINSFIAGLNYEPERLLSVAEHGSTESFPPKTETGGKIVICTNKMSQAKLDSDSISILSPATNVVFPGALLLADKNLANGRPTLVSIPRGPITISTSLTGLSEAEGVVTIEEPTFSKVNQRIKEIAAAFFKNTSEVPAQISLEQTKIYNKFQAAVHLGFNIKSASTSVSSALENNSTMDKTVTAALFRQIYFTASVDAPNEPADFFKNDTTLDMVKQRFSDDKPPAYVSSVSYGRLILVTMQSKGSNSETDIKLAIEAAAAGASAEGKANIKQIVESSTFNIIVLGGDARKASSLTANGQEVFEVLPKVIADGMEMTEQNQGYPIAYTVQFVKDNSLATMSMTTDYNRSECVSYDNGWVQLKQSGGYVGRFFVQAWGNDNNLISNFASGNQTAGWTGTVNIPGDANKVRIFGDAYTGLLWNKSSWDGKRSWATVFDEWRPGPPNQCFISKGTSLNRKAEITKPGQRCF